MEDPSETPFEAIERIGTSVLQRESARSVTEKTESKDCESERVEDLIGQERVMVQCPLVKMNGH